MYRGMRGSKGLAIIVASPARIIRVLFRVVEVSSMALLANRTRERCTSVIPPCPREAQGPESTADRAVLFVQKSVQARKRFVRALAGRGFGLERGNFAALRRTGVICSRTFGARDNLPRGRDSKWSAHEAPLHFRKMCLATEGPVAREGWP